MSTIQDPLLRLGSRLSPSIRSFFLSLRQARQGTHHLPPSPKIQEYTNSSVHPVIMKILCSRNVSHFSNGFMPNIREMRERRRINMYTYSVQGNASFTTTYLSRYKNTKHNTIMLFLSIHICIYKSKQAFTQYSCRLLTSRVKFKIRRKLL